MRAGRRGVTVALVAGGLLVAGCQDEERAVLEEGPAVETPTVPAQGVYGLLALEPFDAAAEEQRVHVRIGSEDRAVSAYQAGLTYTAGSLELVEVLKPGSDFHVVNAEEEGRIRVAGFTTGEFEGPVELVLVFRTAAPIAEGQVTLEFEVAGTPEGHRVHEGDLRVPQGLFELTELDGEEGP